MAYNYDEESVKAIIQWSETAQLPNEVVLSEAEHITDTSIYVRANINDIKQHYPDGFLQPAIAESIKKDGYSAVPSTNSFSLYSRVMAGL